MATPNSRKTHAKCAWRNSRCLAAAGPCFDHRNGTFIFRAERFKRIAARSLYPFRIWSSTGKEIASPGNCECGIIKKSTSKNYYSALFQGQTAAHQSTAWAARCAQARCQAARRRPANSPPAHALTPVLTYLIRHSWPLVPSQTDKLSQNSIFENQQVIRVALPRKKSTLSQSSKKHGPTKKHARCGAASRVPSNPSAGGNNLDRN